MGSSLLQFPQIDSAIAGFENSNPAYNNPMAIQAGSYATNYGATGVAPNGLAIFSNPGQSNAAGDALLANFFDSGQNLSQALQSYTGLDTGSPTLTNYTNYVSQNSGIGLNEIPPVAAMAGNTNQITAADYALPNLPGVPNPFNPQQAQQIVNAAPGGGASAYTALNAMGVTGNTPANPFSGVADSITGLKNWLSGSTSGFSFGRIGLFVLALIVIAGGIFALKPVERLTQSVRAEAGF